MSKTFVESWAAKRSRNKLWIAILLMMMFNLCDHRFQAGVFFIKVYNCYDQILFAPVFNQVQTVFGYIRQRRPSFATGVLLIRAFQNSFSRLVSHRISLYGEHMGYLNTFYREKAVRWKWHEPGRWWFCLQGLVQQWRVHESCLRNVWSIPTLSSGKLNRQGQRITLFKVSDVDLSK